MRKTLVTFTLLVLPLAGCMQDPASRGLAGAAAGAVLADATENSVATGAIIGGLAGMATCGIEVGLPPCQPRY
jgi:hypothetical protein